MFARSLLLAGLATLVAAQSDVLTFTHVPNPVTDGEAQALTYSTNDTYTPVTITLRQGAMKNLQTVQVLTTDAQDGQYVWTPNATLPDGDNYALEITQGSQTNYFGPFVIQGASASTSSSSSSSSSSSTSAAVAVTSSVVSANGTAVTTVIGTVGTAAGTGSAAGTGTALPRNTTMSMATLTASSSTGGSTAGSATTSGAGFQGTSTGASSTATGGAEKVMGFGALALGAAAAAFCL